MNKLQNKKIGIWGLGKVGKAAVTYLSQNNDIELLDSRILSLEEEVWLKAKKIPFFRETHINRFLECNDLIIPSPGIDLKAYAHYRDKWLTELDIIRQTYTAPIIGITGTAGKTTITCLLSGLLQLQHTVWTGGNIGTAMLHLLQEKKQPDFALLEISSFQLEYCKTFAPDFAIWTNFSPNHLDRHGNMEAYFNAKQKIVAFQEKSNLALLPYTIIDKLSLDSINAQLAFFSVDKPTVAMLKKVRTKDTLFYLQDKHIILYKAGIERKIGSIAAFESITFAENLLILFSAFYILNKKYALSEPNKQRFQQAFTTPFAKQLTEHRLEKVATIAGVTFYNDSKATTPASTLAAVNKFSDKPILLLLGGISKGINRTSLIKDIKGKVKSLYSFGKEAEIIKHICIEENIPCVSFTNLKAATIVSFQNATAGDLILLSPAGSSFDLFKNYEARGTYFKQIVHSLTSQ